MEQMHTWTPRTVTICTRPVQGQAWEKRDTNTGKVGKNAHPSWGTIKNEEGSVFFKDLAPGRLNMFQYMGLHYTIYGSTQ